MKKCTQCGREYDNDSLNFCTSCGSVLSVIQPEPRVTVPAVQKCPKCRADLKVGQQFCPTCGNKIDETPVSQPSPKKGKGKIVAVVLAILFAVTTIVFIGLFFYERGECEYYHGAYLNLLNVKFKYDDIESKYDDIKSKYDDIKSKYDDIKSKYDFYYDYAVVVSASTDDGYYHKFGCEELDVSEFRIFNINAAKNEGYKACPHCIDG